MYLLIIAMLAGLAIGYYSNLKLEKIVNKVYLTVVVLLLFFMGVSIGNNKNIFRNLGVIGMESLALAIFGMIGSIVFVKLVERFSLKRVEKK
jgi:uncharacterized membrane protein YbjE (DUF340 family)